MLMCHSQRQQPGAWQLSVCYRSVQGTRSGIALNVCKLAKWHMQGCVVRMDAKLLCPLEGPLAILSQARLQGVDCSVAPKGSV